MMKIQIDETGRFTIPEEIRERFGFRPGTAIALEETEQGLLLRDTDLVGLIWIDGTPVFHCEAPVGFDWEHMVGTIAKRGCAIF
jgi:AbrB family looped-hinge helix DNA binding protein